MDTQANKERKFTQAMEKWIMYFMYALFGGLFLLISLQGSWSEGLILLPIAIISLPLTKSFVACAETKRGTNRLNEKGLFLSLACAEGRGIMPFGPLILDPV